MLNLSMADRLEVALALALDAKKPEFRLIEKASDTAAPTLKDSKGHLSPEGRKALFELKYNPAWGKQGETVMADTFLTGIVHFSPDLRTLNVTIQAFNLAGDKLDTVCSFDAATSLRVLTESGESFAASRGLDEAQTEAPAERSERVVLAERLKVREENQDYSPLEAAECPIEVKVFYNDREVAIHNGEVPDPKTDTRIRFVLRHRNKDKSTYGVVLKVNGENSLYRQHGDDLNCYKWILRPGTEVRIDGFQIEGNDTAAQPFVAASPEESRRDEVHYGHHAGTFTVVVFRERVNDQDRVNTLVNKEEPVTQSIAKGDLEPNGSRSGSLNALQARLRSQAKVDAKTAGGKGLIKASPDKITSNVKEVPFQPYEAPVLSATIRYYHPRSE